MKADHESSDNTARRSIVQDLDDNILVDAGPGSGKTKELIDRMVQLIKSGKARNDDIAAITFTRKAARELQEKFQKSLAEAAKKSDPEDSASLERLDQAQKSHPSPYIGTVHGFCTNILRERGYRVGLDAAFEIVPDWDVEPSRKRFFDAYLERLTREGDAGLEALAQMGVPPWSLFDLFSNLLQHPDVEFRADDTELPAPTELAPVRKHLDVIINQAWELMPEVEPDGKWNPLQKVIREMRYLREVTDWDDRYVFLQALSSLCKPNGEVPKATAWKCWKDKEKAKELAERVHEFGKSGPAREMVNLWYQHMYAVVLGFTLSVRKDFLKYRIQSGKLEFHDLLYLSAKLLRSDHSARRELAKHYPRLLVDEFQDTDPLQAEILFLIASEPPSELGDNQEENSGWLRAVPRPGSLFVVGDPKQSIYRFRRADIAIYDLVKKRFEKEGFGKVVRLTTNYRSSPEICDFINTVFGEDRVFPPHATGKQAEFNPLQANPVLWKNKELPDAAICMYEVCPDKNSSRPRARDDAHRIAAWIRQRIEKGEREAKDFLVLTRTKKRLDEYARALEEHDLPAQVTGAGVKEYEEIRELRILLECMIDPTNPVKVVAALVGLFFGLDYDRLVTHRLDGGGFDAMRPQDQGHPDVLEALTQLHKWWMRAGSQPADVFVSALTSELGLLPYAAASELGSLRAGVLVYLLNVIRAATLAGNASLPGALDALQSAISSSDARAALEPEREDAIQVMTVHQAKGGEAKVVVLAEPNAPQPTASRIKMHVSRDKDGTPVGSIRVNKPQGGQLVQPPNWEELGLEEEEFQAAEENRLVYVAATRAMEELVVSRREPGKSGKSKDASVWKVLHPRLDKWATDLRLDRGPHPHRDNVKFTADQAHRAGNAASERLAELAVPSFTYSTVTEEAKGNPDPGFPDPAWSSGDPDQAFRGFAWGNVVHAALAAAASEPSVDAFYATCRDLLIEYDRPLDDHGDPVELDELLELVNSIRASDLWIRAQGAERVLAEVSFAAPGFVKQVQDAAGEGDIPGKPGVSQSNLFEDEMESSDEQDDSDEGVTPSSAGHVLEGVIDLAFLEDDGWVIADYKTDVGTDPDFAIRSRAYRRQVDLYADAWTQLTGEAVKERMLFFTAQDRIESW